MNWSSDAAAMVASAPPILRGLIRRTLEKSARKEGLDLISAEFVATARAGAHRQRAGTTDGPLAGAFAHISENPMADAFPPGDDVHIFPTGEHLDGGAACAAWEVAASRPPGTEGRRALYLHVPFCRARCSFCPFYANRWTEDAGRTYVAALEAELAGIGRLPVASAPFDAVYFGGGTPSDLHPEGLRAVLGAVRRHIPLASDAEVTLEGRACGHSPTLTEAAIEAGVNRFSVGIQSFDTALRRSLGRIEPRERLLAFLDRLCDTGAVVVIDLIYGLPGQTPAVWEEDLRTLTGLTRLAGADLYRLKVIPGSPLARRQAEAPAALQRRCASLFSTGCRILDEAGWEQISVSHWRRDKRERSRYNTMTKSGADCVPAGCGAGGRLGGIRFFQTGELDAYLTAIRQGLKPLASATRLCPNSFSVDRIASDCDRATLLPTAWHLPDAGSLVPRLLDQWQKAGLLEPESGGSWKLTRAGQFHNVAMGNRLANIAQNGPRRS
jgi:anaerobilin synthase